MPCKFSKKAVKVQKTCQSTVEYNLYETSTFSNQILPANWIALHINELHSRLQDRQISSSLQKAITAFKLCIAQIDTSLEVGQVKHTPGRGCPSNVDIVLFEVLAH